MAGHRIKRGVKIPRKPAPYGRRADSLPLIGDPDWYETSAEWAPYPDGEKRQIAMPRGRGVRWLVACPHCDQWVKTLYQPAQLRADPDWWRCRHCWGLRYPSQYAGRRPECDPDRMMALLDSALRARKRGNEALAHARAQRFLDALDTYQAGEAIHEYARVAAIGAQLTRDLAAVDALETRYTHRSGHQDGTPHAGPRACARGG